MLSKYTATDHAIVHIHSKSCACKISIEKIVNTKFQKSSTGVDCQSQLHTFWFLAKIKLLEHMPGKLCLETMFSPILVLELVLVGLQKDVVKSFMGNLLF